MIKKQLLTIILLGCIALAGCGKKGSDQTLENDLIGDLVTKQETPSLEPEDGTAEGDRSKENAAKDDNLEEDTSESNTAKESTEQEPYVLTFEAATIEGEEWNSDKLADSKLTMINVWATYCNPCLAEMPDLGEIAAAYDTSEFQMLGIISDVMEGDNTDNLDYAKELIAETGANYPHLLLNESLYMNLVGVVSAVPTTFFVNEDSEVLGYVTGACSKEVWEELINDLLAENQ